MLAQPFISKLIQQNKITESKNNQKRKALNKPYWKNSDKSEHFGKRNQIVKVNTKNGITSMKLKNALKKGLQYFNTPA